ncbi:MAG: MEDS domain-containing protein, partial [Acidobacteriota bacterium]|nr:MEDS domain-containing protein [Acidobacteriota bacterium]
DNGAPHLRLLGNIGWGRSGWPDEADILVFETRVTAAIADLPCVVVCMYDVQNLPGRILVHGALEAHPLTLRQNVVRENHGLRGQNQFTSPFLTAKRKSS